MKITKHDIIWNYAATFLKIASSVLLLPLILRMMPSEMIAIWTIFITITAFSTLLDFGFNSSFTRNVTYVFSGVNSLKVNGFEISSIDGWEVGLKTIDYSLLKGLISAMRWFYLRVAIVLFLLLITFGTYYIFNILDNYKGNHREVYIAWFLLCIINTYNLFTLYYESLLQGTGLIKRSKQIIIIGQVVYLIIATILILIGKGLIAIVIAQMASVVIIRWISYKSFFTYSLKMGLTGFGGLLVLKSAIIIGSLYLTLDEIASYGITLQLIYVIIGLSSIYFATYYPKITQLRIHQDINRIKQLYIKSLIVSLVTFIFCGIGLVLIGEWAFELINSRTELMSSSLIVVALLISFLESNHSMAGGILLSKNEVPFFKASLLSGGLTIILLIGLLHFTQLGIWALVLAPGIAQGVYQNWKWPQTVFKELSISLRDVYKSIITFF